MQPGFAFAFLFVSVLSGLLFWGPLGLVLIPIRRCFILRGLGMISPRR
jgi:hypothetical protein